MGQSYKRGSTLRERFLLKISFTESCWQWCSLTNGKDGYGRIKIGQRPVSAHRVSYQLFKGPITANQVVMHTCDNRLCVNPAHLMLGTSTDNHKDMCSKGRNVRGSRVNTSKLTATHVREIRQLYACGIGAPTLAKQFGVRHPSIYNIVHRRSWKDVE